MGQAAHEVQALGAHVEPGAIVQGDVPVQDRVHHLAHALVAAFLQGGPAQQQRQQT